jgi:hypothetical protein
MKTELSQQNISNLKYDITATPQYIHSGCRNFTHEKFKKLTIDQCEPDWSKKEFKLFKKLGKLAIKQVKLGHQLNAKE